MREDHLSYYGKYLKNDIRASIVVFLVAVPLALGIALASGAPLFSGLIAAIIGGVVVSVLSGSQVSVSGPAAGLAVIVFMAIETLGSFQAFLVAVVLAGIMQIVMGYLKAGTIGAFFPSSVIKAMLAAIGLILIIKQIPHAFGYDGSFEGDESYMQENFLSSMADIATALTHLAPAAIIISLVSLVVLFLWEKPFIKQSIFGKFVPGALMVVLFGVGFNLIMQQFYPAWALGSTHLVSLPVLTGYDDLMALIVTPDWSILSNSAVYTIAATIAIIASIETLLSLEAADKIDPLKRVAPTNQELKAQGVGNILSGLIGGLPVTAVIVRSSTNVYNGGKTKVSAFMHGVWLLLAVLFFSVLLNYIPLASLAAILLFIGYKLATPSLFKQIYAEGWDQFIPFIVTVVAILLTDLLAGIAMGMVVGLLFVIRSNYKESISMQKMNNIYTLTLHKDVNFLNKALLRSYLAKVEDDSHLIIDGSRSQFVDHDILETIDDFIITSKDKGISVERRLFVDFTQKDEIFWERSMPEGQN
jgi:MFS superfamily sulfate permease-like transporter